MTILTLILKYRYLILFPLAVVEGPIIAFVGGMLIALGYLGIPQTFLILLLGDFIPDNIFYLLGKRWARTGLIMRRGARFGLTEARIAKIAKLFHTHSFKTMLVSKFAYGMTPAFLISAGFVQMPLRRFFGAALSISAVTYALLLTLGYYFGSSYAMISKYIHNVQLFIGALIILFVVGYFLFARYMKKKLITTEVETKI